MGRGGIEARGQSCGNGAKALDGLVAGYYDRVLPLELDVTDEKNVKAAIEQAHQHFGRLDIVLSNAGYGVMGAIEEASLDETRAAFETNVLGAQSVVKAAVPLLRTQQSGHILAVSSMAGLRPFPLGGVYVATKFALEGMMETLAQEVVEFGIKAGTSERIDARVDTVACERQAATLRENDSLVNWEKWTCSICQSA